MDLDTGQGLVSDVSLKRKVRDGVDLQVQQGSVPAEGNGIFIRRGVSLNEQLRGVTQEDMVKNYFDVRMFGAVMTTGGSSAGKVTGPVTIGIARSLDPVLPIDMGITRVASTREEDRDNASQMGNKTVVPYGLYQAVIHYQPTKDNLVTASDLQVLWTTLGMMFDWTRSAARPEINVRYLGGFSHDNPLGNAPARRLLDSVVVTKRADVQIPRSFADYQIAEPSKTPAGVSYWRLV